MNSKIITLLPSCFTAVATRSGLKDYTNDLGGRVRPTVTTTEDLPDYSVLFHLIPGQESLSCVAYSSQANMYRWRLHAGLAPTFVAFEIEAFESKTTDISLSKQQATVSHITNRNLFSIILSVSFQTLEFLGSIHIFHNAEKGG